MKRSEMVSALAEKMRYEFPIETGIDKEDCIWYADSFLAFLEETGMVPPAIPYYGCLGCSQCYGSDKDFVNEWENE